jgi:hypothetical protein
MIKHYRTLSQDEQIEQETARADRFVRGGILAQNRAHQYSDCRFFAQLAYQRAFLAQVRYLRDARADGAILSMKTALREFVCALEMGYATEASEVSNWFYRAAVINDCSIAQFLAALPDRVWPHGDTFSRYQALWGFALFRGQEGRAREIVEYLSDLYTAADESLAGEKGHGKLRLMMNACNIMKSILERDWRPAESHLAGRMELRSLVPLEGTRYERFQPLDLVGLGFCRLARQRGSPTRISHSRLPFSLLDTADAAAGEAKPRLS